MKLIYITGYTFPSKRAEPYYIRSMAKAFVLLLGNDFTLLVRGDITPELAGTNAESVPIPNRLRVAWYLLWFPFFVFRRKLYQKETVLMSNDPYLLLVFIFWRFMLRFKYRVSSDWHQLYDDWKDTLIARNSDHLFTTTKMLKQHLVALGGVESEKICVAYGGIDPELFTTALARDKKELRTELGLPVDAFLVGYLGGFKSVGQEKGLKTMIVSLRHLENSVHIVLVGGSWSDIEEHRAFAEEIGVKDRCILVPRQKFERLIQYEVAMDILAIPYPDKPHFRKYGFPLKVWEYMAAGRPIIYSNLPIIAEVLEGRATPCIPDDPKDLARVILSVREQYQSYAHAAMQNPVQVQEYTWNARVAKIFSFNKNW